MIQCVQNLHVRPSFGLVLYVFLFPLLPLPPFFLLRLETAHPPFCITTIPHTNRSFFVVLLMDKSMFINVPLGVFHSIHMAFVTVCRSGGVSLRDKWPHFQFCVARANTDLRNQVTRFSLSHFSGTVLSSTWAPRNRAT